MKSWCGHSPSGCTCHAMPQRVFKPVIARTPSIGSLDFDEALVHLEPLSWHRTLRSPKAGPTGSAQIWAGLLQVTTVTL